MVEVVQALLSIPDYVDILGKSAPQILDEIDPSEMNESVVGQMAKLFSSLVSGNFAKVSYHGIKSVYQVYNYL